MIVRLRLAQVLEELGEVSHGLVRRLAEHTGLKRQVISAMLHGDFKYVGLESLGRVCDYMVDKHHIPPDELPGLLFFVEPEQFSGEVVNRKYLEFVLGVRRIREGQALPKGAAHGPGLPKLPQRWVMASDSTLHGELLHELFGRGDQRWQARPNVLEQRLVPSYSGPGSENLVQTASTNVYDSFLARQVRRACLSMGSIKSNGVSEIILARTFQANAFTSDDADTPNQRRCPVFIRYRKDDPRPPSCHGGIRLAKSHPSPTPGIYYETPGGEWNCCPVDDRRDAAVVLFANHLLEGRLEIVMAGFTGRATRCLGTRLRWLTERFWPPAYQRPQLHLGLFVVKFQFEEEPEEADDEAELPKPTDIDVISLTEEVLAQRLD